MNKYQKNFGSGPVGLVVSMLTLAVAGFTVAYFDNFSITASKTLRYFVFIALSLLTLCVIVWGIYSLPIKERGNRLVTSGAFKYFRHPYYAAFLTFFNFGLAFLLNNWTYILWAIFQHPLWHWLILYEENLMEMAFPGEYVRYALKTGRFIPRIIRQKNSIKMEMD